MERAAFLAALVKRIVITRPDGIARVAITGVDGAGKTRLADDLVELIADRRPVIRASIDGFHNPRAVRYGRGRTSPEGFYRDSFNLDLFRATLLEPLAPGGTRHYRTAAFDHRTDSAVDMPEQVANQNAVLLVDGIFLQQPALADVWDLTIFLDVPFTATFARMAVRDGSPADEADPANQRYRKGQQMYLTECDPKATAAVLVDYADFNAPRLVRI